MRITRHTDGNVDGIEMLRLMAPLETPYEPHTALTRDDRRESDTGHLEDRNALTGREKADAAQQ